MSDGETTQQVGEPKGTSTVCAVVLIGTMVIETTINTWDGVFTSRRL